MMFPGIELATLLIMYG